MGYTPKRHHGAYRSHLERLVQQATGYELVENNFRLSVDMCGAIL